MISQYDLVLYRGKSLISNKQQTVCEDLEVVGNIHDNLELLEVKE